MIAIWKYTLQIGHNTIEVPRGATALHVHEQIGDVCLWVLVDSNVPKEPRRFLAVGTGWSLDEVGDAEARYIGTAHCGVLVWHVFETTEATP